MLTAIAQQRVQPWVLFRRVQGFLQRLHRFPAAALPSNQRPKLLLDCQLLVSLRQHLFRDMTDVL